MYVVYILKCNDGSLYTGITTDVNRRFAEHVSGAGARYTRSKGVREIVYVETKKNRSTASKREVEIKKMRREKKLELIKAIRGAKKS